jgi:hypothetical protein
MRPRHASLLALACLSTALALADEQVDPGGFTTVVGAPGERVVRCAVRTYAPPAHPLDFPTEAEVPPRPLLVLVATVHIAEPAFYARLEQVLAEADLVLHEGRAPRIAVASRQERLGTLALEHDWLPIPPDRSRCADAPDACDWLLPPKVGKLLEEATEKIVKGFEDLPRSEGPPDPAREDRIDRLRRREIIDWLVDPTLRQPAAPGWDDVVMAQRNAVAIGELVKASYEPGRRRVALLYGAAHHAEIAAFVTGPLGYRPTGVEWVDAVREQPPPPRRWF